MNSKLRQYFQRFSQVGGFVTPPGPMACALDKARTLLEWEGSDNVRIRMQEESGQEFSDAFGADLYEASKREIELWGIHLVFTEYRAPSGEWVHADSIGMCIYRNPLDPFDNDYVPDLMRAALDARAAAWADAACAV